VYTQLVATAAQLKNRAPRQAENCPHTLIGFVPVRPLVDKYRKDTIWKLAVRPLSLE
jgi:hypothetical protein